MLITRWLGIRCAFGCLVRTCTLVSIRTLRLVRTHARLFDDASHWIARAEVRMPWVGPCQGPRPSVQLARHVPRTQGPTLARPQPDRRPSKALSSRLGSPSCPPAPVTLVSLTRVDHNS